MKKHYDIERLGQIDFFDNFRIDYQNQPVLVDDTDGVYNGNLFEFKTDITDLNTVEAYEEKEFIQEYKNYPGDVLYFNKDGVKKFVFDVSFLNERAYRLPVGTSDNPYEPKDLVMGDEHSAMNRLYERFQVYDFTPNTFIGGNFETMNKNVTTPLDSADPNPYCPEGYRLPNQREMALMTIYLQKYYFLSGIIMTRTSYSFGSPTLGGTGKDPTKLGFTWENNLFLSNSGKTATQARCVKDLLPGEFD